MKFRSALARPPRRTLLLAAVFVFAHAPAQTAPSAPAPSIPPSIPTVPGKPGNMASTPSSYPGPPPMPQTPWYDNRPLPSEDELKVLQAARDAAEKDLEVVIANKTYAERFGAADDLVRTRIFSDPVTKNPDYQSALVGWRWHQVIFENLWEVGQFNRDPLFPDPQVGTFSAIAGLTIHMSSGSGGSNPSPMSREDMLAREENAAQNDSDPVRRARRLQGIQSLKVSFVIGDIRQAALAGKEAQTAIQKVRDAFKALDDTVRASMAKDPAVKVLIDKYPFLIFGRKDLGFHVAFMSFMT